MDFRVISNQPIDQRCLFLDLSVGETIEGVLSIEVGQQQGFRGEAVTAETEVRRWVTILLGLVAFQRAEEAESSRTQSPRYG